MRVAVVELPTGTVTIVVAEGRRMMRLARELAPDVFGALLEEYQQLLRQVLESMGGRDVNFDSDTAAAAFPTAKQAALAAVAAQRAIAAHEWPHGRELAMSVGLDLRTAGAGLVEPAVVRCSQLCDAAEGGQIFMTQAVSHSLEDEDLGELVVRDRGEVPLRRSDQKVRAYELVMPAD
jgi:class 3 adenylate cyclase